MQKAGLMRAPLPLRQINTICTFFVVVVVVDVFSSCLCLLCGGRREKQFPVFHPLSLWESLLPTSESLLSESVSEERARKKKITQETHAAANEEEPLYSLYTLSLPCLPPSLPLLSLCPPHLCRWCLMKIRWDQKQIPSKGAGYVMHIMCERRYSVMSAW